MMRIFIQSCHASLEFDVATMFLRMGHEVAGNFDVGSRHRPKIKGVTDTSYPLEFGVEEADVYYLMQCEDYSNVFEKYAAERKDRGVVVLNLFGQGCEDQHKHTAYVLNNYSNAFAVSYSHKDHNHLIELGANPDKARMIRFGKDLTEFREHGGWHGRLPVAYMSCNGIQHRNEGTSWPMFNELMKTDVPLILSGNDSRRHPYGIGDLDYAALKAMYRQCACYVSLGTKPAPLVLTLIEAVCSGTPVIAYDNGCGIANEQLGGVVVVKDVVELYNTIKMLTGNKVLCQKLSNDAASYADHNFSMEVVGDKWAEFFRRMGI
jgi:hypothetical protein